MKLKFEIKKNEPKKIAFSTNSKTMAEIPKNRTKEYVTNYVYKWIDILHGKNLEFVTPLWDLVIELRYCSGRITQYKTMFRRTDIDYTHPTAVLIQNVLNDHTRIWTKQEKQKYEAELYAKICPRGSDANGDKETACVDVLMSYCSAITDMFDTYETVRGSMVDIILIPKINDQESVALQIGTAEQGRGRTFDVHKTPRELYQLLMLNIAIILIGTVNKQLAGSYLIVPTPAAKEEFAKLAKSHGSVRIAPALLGKKNTASDLTRALQKYRYIHPDFQKDVEGKFKNLNDFSSDFLNMIRDNHHTMINTPQFWSMLFKGGNKSQLAEWAYNVAIKRNVEDPLGIKQRINHGERGDMILEFGNVRVLDERKLLKIHSSVKNLISLILDLRKSGRQGLHPSKVRTVTCPIRGDRSNKNPGNPEDYIALSVFSVITESGDLALRPDAPSSQTLSMSCDVANRSEYIDITVDKIGVGAFPAHLCEIIGIWHKHPKLRIKCVFYFDQLKSNPEKLIELRDLYTMFSEREVSANAIINYENAVTDELIDIEKKRLKGEENKEEEEED